MKEITKSEHDFYILSISKKNVLEISHFQSLEKNSNVNKKKNQLQKTSQNSSKNTQFHSQTYCFISLDANNCNPLLFTRI
jgi:hypothetical protein